MAVMRHASVAAGMIQAGGPRSTPMKNSYRIGRFEIRPDERQVLADEVPQPIGARAFDLLLALVERRDRVVTKNELLEQVWPGLVVEENNIQVHISALRKLLGSAAIATVPGRGYRFTLEVDNRRTADSSEAALPPPVAHNLPRARTRFIGRKAQRAQLAQLLQTHALITLTGIGGAGKTRLALRVAEDVLAMFPSGAWYVDLAALQDPAELPTAALRALDIQAPPGANAAEVLARHVGEKRMLLILDNCEHVIDAAVVLAESLLARCVSLTVLATSREALGLPGEQVLPVRPLQVVATSAAADLEQSDAVQLFVDRAQLVDPDFALDERGARTAGEICRRLDGIPLAIELAAARLSVLSLEQISSRLDDRFRLLTGGGHALARHRTLAAVVDWSYETLSPQEKRLLCWMSIFVGGWDLAAAVGASGDGVDEFGALELLTRLANKSLIVAQRDNEEARYGMLETVRQYAHDRLMAAGELESARRSHRHHYLAIVRALPEGREARERALGRLVIDRENVLAALRDFIAHGDAAEAVEFIAGLGHRFWEETQSHRSGLDLASAALGLAATGTPTLDVLKTLLVQGQLAYRLGAYELALEHGRATLEMARTMGDLARQSSALLRLVACHTALRNSEDAWTALGEWAPIAQRVGPEAVLVMRHYQAELLRSEGRVTEAEAVYQQVLDGRTRMKSQYWISLTHLNLAMCALQLGDTTRAAKHQLRASLASDDDSGSLAICFAAVAAGLGAWDWAARMFGVDRQYRERTGIEWEPLDWAVIRPLLDKTRETLGEARFNEVANAGAAMSPRTAMQQATDWLKRIAQS